MGDDHSDCHGRIAQTAARKSGPRAVATQHAGDFEMKTMVRELTRKIHIYEPLRRVSDGFKWSKTYEYFHDAMHPKSKRAKRGELALFRSLVPAGATCFDIGANIGGKASIYLEHHCRVIALEPVPRNVEILRMRFGRNPCITLVNMAVSDSVGQATLNVIEDNTSFSSFSKSWAESLQTAASNRWGIVMNPPTALVVQTTTLDLLIAQYGAPYYIKVDVEGHELSVLRGLTQRVPLLSFEANLPEFQQETHDCVAALLEIDPSARFNYATEWQDRWQLPEWQSGPAFQRLLATTPLRFMEIYCRSI